MLFNVHVDRISYVTCERIIETFKLTELLSVVNGQADDQAMN